jgi:hypothetical protein
MHQNTFVALFIAGLVPLAASQTIDPSTVDQSTKGEDTTLKEHRGQHAKS